MKLLPIAVLLLAQAAAPQRFDVASVKPCEANAAPQGRAGGAGNNGSVGSVIFNCARPVSFIYTAYVVNGSQTAGEPINMWVGANLGTQFAPGANDQRVRGGPAWAYTERFTVEAKAPGPSDVKTMQGPMLRALLEERFHLKVHQGTEEVQMWALTIAAGGSKLKPPVPGACVALAPGQQFTREIFNANLDKIFCNRRTGLESDTSMTWRFGGQPISQLTDAIALSLGVKVLDQTGLAGTFDFSLEYALDDNTMDAGRPRTTPASPSSSPSIFSAVQDQLGLKLVKTKGSRGFIVIDQIERPSPDLRSFPAALTAAPTYWYNLYHDKTY